MAASVLVLLSRFQCPMQASAAPLRLVCHRRAQAGAGSRNDAGSDPGASFTANRCRPVSLTRSGCADSSSANALEESLRLLELNKPFFGFLEFACVHAPARSTMLHRKLQVQ